MTDPDDTPVEETTADDEWQPLMRRELVQTAVAVATYVVIKLAIDLYDEDSKVRWWIRREWRNIMRAISSEEENRAIATAAARGIEYTTVWLGRQWEMRKK